ncbi:protein kinase, putative [Bodo saltans]|uniref:Protein kinase, putative n=1 Tax=Bodo saltans TaxID=75058 RepID=A0A0S4JUE6_BODSA|nr:protein kinase, putative [Bodo saltans]|eukprot:CUG92720.1 protein kinase, putative [Bodo saltans]
MMVFLNSDNDASSRKHSSIDIPLHPSSSSSVRAPSSLSSTSSRQKGCLSPRNFIMSFLLLIVCIAVAFVWLIPHRGAVIIGDNDEQASIVAATPQLKRNAIKPAKGIHGKQGTSKKNSVLTKQEDIAAVKEKMLSQNKELAEEGIVGSERQRQPRRQQLLSIPSATLSPVPNKTLLEGHKTHDSAIAHKGKASPPRRQHDVDAAKAKKASLKLTTAAPATLPPPSLISDGGYAMRTYDDIIRRDIDQKFYVYNSSVVESTDKQTTSSTSPFSPLAVCDDVHVPFAPSHDDRCAQFLAAVSQTASLSSELPVVVEVSVPSWNAPHKYLHHFSVNVSFEPVAQKFEQRTIKFRFVMNILSEWLVEIHPKSSSLGGRGRSIDVSVESRREHEPGAYMVRCMLKVPQVLFPLEPFAEVAAYEIDRKLRIHRVPPTTLVAISIDWIKQQSVKRAEQEMKMVPEFLEASRVANYDEWIEFLKQSKQALHKVSTKFDKDDEAQQHSRFTFNKTHVWCSLQLFLREVQPLLYTPLRVPYSKQHPGWHRWFDVEFNEYPVSEGPLLALSQMAIFDCILMNNDRSPNKNNFAVGGCRKCPPHERRTSGLPPTVVHLDHGMSFYGKDALIPHNPIAKTPKKVRFCIFYAPLMRVLLRLDAQFEGKEAQWRAFMLNGINPFAANVIGHDKVRDTGSMVVKVLNRMRFCIKEYNETAVLRP